MRTFTVHANASVPREEDQVLFVKEGMARWALVSPVLWFLYHRLWWEAAAYFGLTILIALLGEALGVQENITLILGFGIQVLVAMEANDVRRLGLARKGYQTLAVVHGADEQEAEARFFANWSHALPEASAAPVTSAVMDWSGEGQLPQKSAVPWGAAKSAVPYTKNTDAVWPKRAPDVEPGPTAPPGDVLGLFPKPPGTN